MRTYNYIKENNKNNLCYQTKNELLEKTYIEMQKTRTRNTHQKYEKMNVRNDMRVMTRAEEFPKNHHIIFSKLFLDFLPHSRTKINETDAQPALALTIEMEED